MVDPVFELCARRPADLATLELLACALEEAGASTRLVVLSELAGGGRAECAPREPGACQVRIGIADPERCTPLGREGALAVALIEDRIEVGPLSRERPDLEQAQQLLVAGPLRERELDGKLEASVRSCGLARLDRLGETCLPLAAPELLVPGPALPRYLKALLELRAEVARAAAVPSGEAQVLAEVEALLAFGDSARAIHKLEAHLLGRDSVEGRRLLARVERGVGREDRAARALNRADRLARENLASVLADRGRLLVDQGKIDEARQLFEECLRMAPDCADGHLGLGSLLLHAGHGSDARREFQAALDREPGAAPWCGLGLALGVEERHVESLEAFERALELDPESEAALFGVVQAGFAAGCLEPASRWLETFLERHPGNLDLTFTLAGIRKELGEGASALQLLDRIQTFEVSYPGARELARKLEGTRIA